MADINITNKVTADDALDNYYTITTYIDSEPVSIDVRPMLPLSEIMTFVRDVVDSCIDRDNGDYLPEVFDFAKRAFTIAYYTHGLDVPEDYDELYDLLYNSDIYEDVVDEISETQYAEICKSIDAKIAYEVNMLTSTAFAKVNEMLKELAEFMGAIKDAFKGMNSEDMARMVEAVSKIDNMDEQSLAAAILNIQNDGGEK